MKKAWIHIVLGILMVSCDDFLDQQPGLEVSIDEQLSTELGVEQALAGVYVDMEDLLSNEVGVYADLQGGNLTFTPRPFNRIVSPPELIEGVYGFSENELNTRFTLYYNGQYTIIAQVNTILERTPFAFISTEKNDQLRAELLVFRALCHYLLSLHYAQNYHFTADASHLGVVYNKQTLKPGVDFPSRLTMNETYDAIKSDLDEALELITDENILKGEADYAYWNALNAQALYARIALQMNDWEQAFFFANEVINTSNVSLTTKENYVSEWEQDPLSMSEVLFEFATPKNDEGSVSSSISEHYRINNEEVSYVASGDLLDLYASEDVRSDMFLVDTLTTFINQVNTDVRYFFTKKFQGDAGVIFIRLSEMYLIRAESNARLNNPSLALNDLNLIRERAGLSALENANELLEEIFLERRRELAFEGHLLFDIKRFKKNIIRDQGCISLQCDLSYPSDFFILPIPFTSIGLNNNIEQNDGY